MNAFDGSFLRFRAGLCLLLLWMCPLLHASEPASGTLVLISSLGVWGVFILVPWLLIRCRKALWSGLSRLFPGRDA